MSRLLLAMDFAAKKHVSQRRKNKEGAPYINHPVEVALQLSSAGEIADEDVLIAALLHDTIEDTDTTASEGASIFGKGFADLALECSYDKTLPKLERKRLQIIDARKKSDGAKFIKIADKTCNLRSILVDPPMGWSLERQYEYFIWAEQVVAGLLGVSEALGRDVLNVLREGLGKLKREDV